MAAVDILQTTSPTIALPGLGRALVSAGKLGQKSAEDLYRKALSSKNSFIAELVGSGAVSASDLAHTLSAAFAAPLLDVDAIDKQRLPKDLLDSKICSDFRVVVLRLTRGLYPSGSSQQTQQPPAGRDGGPL